MRKNSMKSLKNRTFTDCIAPELQSCINTTMSQQPVFTKFKLPPEISQLIRGQLTLPPKRLARSVQNLSDQFHAGDMTPWHKPELLEAYLAYFFPLNFIRNQTVIQRILPTGVFDQIDHIIEVGSGCGTSHFALDNLGKDFKYDFYELSRDAVSTHIKLSEELDLQRNCQWHTNKLPTAKTISNPKTLLLFSYSLNEFEEVPEWIYEAQNLLIIEPSTKYDARRLMSLRAELLKAGLNPLAPCTHSKSCPLLEESKKDWCHDRVHIEMPDWFKKLEGFLPMKNSNLTFSYLLASKHLAPNQQGARIIGDSQKQKGKTIQMICRGDEREFLCWMKKNKNEQMIERGSVVDIPEDIEAKNNELRVKSQINLK